MKIAISLPDELSEAADDLAQRLGMPRSRLFAMAVAEYLAKHRDDEITQRLNEVYAAGPQTSEPAEATEGGGMGQESEGW